MNTKQIAIVQGTFSQIEPIAVTAASLFYQKLFALDQNIRPMFKSDISSQGNKLMKMLGTAVGGLNNLNSLIPVIESLGQRHADYGVKDEHYDTVGEALLWTLEQGLGSDFTDEVKEAWIQTYAALACVMKRASKVAVEQDEV